MQLGFTPLHLACQEGKKDVTKMLIEFGAKPNVEATVSVFTRGYVSFALM